MRLTKNQLIKLTKKGLEELGYREMKDTITGAQGFYIKRVKREFYLTLGLTISRYYDCKFTGAFYLSKVTTWGAIWGDIPKKSYERVGCFLTKEERQALLEKRYYQDGVVDAWWDLDDQNAVAHFIETIRITEDRFLTQPDIFENISNSLDVIELEELAKMVIAKMTSNKVDNHAYRFIPTKPIDGIPIEWFKASERVIEVKKAILNSNTVKRLAADAYKQSNVSNI